MPFNDVDDESAVQEGLSVMREERILAVLRGATAAQSEAWCSLLLVPDRTERERMFGIWQRIQGSGPIEWLPSWPKKIPQAEIAELLAALRRAAWPANVSRRNLMPEGVPSIPAMALRLVKDWKTGVGVICKQTYVQTEVCVTVTCTVQFNAIRVTGLRCTLMQTTAVPARLSVWEIILGASYGYGMKKEIARSKPLRRSTDGARKGIGSEEPSSISTTPLRSSTAAALIALCLTKESVIH